MALQKYYAVVNGRKCNTIVESWAACERLVAGFSRAKFKSFKSRNAAKAYLMKNKTAGGFQTPKSNKKSTSAWPWRKVPGSYGSKTGG